MPTTMLEPGAWAQMENRYGCVRQDLSTGVCKLHGGPCPYAPEDRKSGCGEYIHPSEAVRKHCIPKKFRQLIEDAPGRMVFVEYDDPRFTDADLVEMIDFMVQGHQQLLPYIVIDRERTEGTAWSRFTREFSAS